MKKSIRNVLTGDIDLESIYNDADKRNYGSKLKEYIAKVYGCNYSQKPKCNVKLKRTIDQDVEKPKFDMNEDVDNLILIAVEYYWLPPYMADRVKHIMVRMWSYPDNFHDIRYENVILGILMYVIYENLIVNCAVDEIVDFRDLCSDMFGAEQAEKRIRQIYRAYGIVHGSYEEVEREYEAYELERRERKYKRMKEYNRE